MPRSTQSPPSARRTSSEFGGRWGSYLLIVVVAVVLLAQRCHLWASALGPYFFIETVAAPPYTLVSPARFSLQNTLPEACSTAARSVLTNRDCRADAKCYDCNEGGCQGT